MLARANRVVKPSDFRAIVRRGRRASTASMLIYRVERDASDPARFGFIVAKTVGNAVERNLVRRRMRAVCRSVIDSGGRGADVVIRALPASASTDWSTLERDIHEILDPVLIR
ncbi:MULTISPECIES: ribonuclease P protein component [unclassified Salinibacterium]|uniref:ribonuclease P protein component n=1 Tax=Salinibacterium sp. ZJ77 TaxID=2708337 RepID=UPI001424942E|nr:MULTISPECIES: ribonuclease P protein component [unclassified Salinibacterium]